ncbi:MAG: hypothetical protein WA869_18415, partial [Alloacidobacterium sp.]
GDAARGGDRLRSGYQCQGRVEKHRQHLMEKLHIHDIAGLTRYAIAAGVIESSVHQTIADDRCDIWRWVNYQLGTPANPT